MNIKERLSFKRFGRPLCSLDVCESAEIEAEIEYKENMRL